MLFPRVLLLSHRHNSLFISGTVAWLKNEDDLLATETHGLLLSFLDIGGAGKLFCFGWAMGFF